MNFNGELAGSIRFRRFSSKRPPRFFRGTPWVYSNELEAVGAKHPPGAWVALESPEGRTLGVGFYNPHSLIAFRFFSARRPLDFKAEVEARLDAALALRERELGASIERREVGPRSFRLVFGESDGLPGLITDLFESAKGPVAVAQCHAAGADAFLAPLWDWLQSRLKAAALVVRNDVEIRAREMARLYTETFGALPASVYAIEGGVRFEVQVIGGQKTGYFYDLRAQRRLFAEKLRSSAGVLLDCFSYIGSWGLQALRINPRLELLAADVSKAALEQLRANAEANGMGARVRAVSADLLKEDFPFEKDRFSGVVCDPPALTSSAKQAEQGKRAHANVFAKALRVAAPGSVVAFASCSFHLSMDDFLSSVASASHVERKRILLTEIGSQDCDHPVLAALPESRYLKAAMGMALGGE